MTQYYIDQKLISMFLDADPNSEEVINYMSKYSEKLTKLIEEGIRKYLKEKKNMSDEQIEREFEKVDSFDQADQAVLLDDDVAVEAERIRHKFNKEIYDYYAQVLDNDQKKKINVYLQQQQENINKDFEEQQKMMLDVLSKIKNEYEQTGDLKEQEEPTQTPMSDEDLMTIQKDLEEEIGKVKT
ncbi:hypothetical protein GF362_01635 [Candidatus Dojkabacteria bacterium]|nr:hypothetical protein [Candidatus Dojkabacteria bacterium]